MTATEMLTKKDELEAVGGASYLAQLASQVPTAANVVYHAKIVRDKALMRSLIRSSTDIAGKVYEESSEADDLLNAAIDEAISRKPKGHDFVIDRAHNKPALARHMSVTGG